MNTAEIKSLEREIRVAFKEPLAEYDGSFLIESPEKLAALEESEEFCGIPFLMLYTLNEMQNGRLPRRQAENVLFALDPEGTFKNRSNSRGEKILFARQLEFLTKFNSSQRDSIRRWVELLARVDEMGSYFRSAARIMMRFTL